MKKLKVLREEQNNNLTLRFVGSIQEDSTLDDVVSDTNKNIVVDVGEINFINSTGAYKWSKWSSSLPRATSLTFVNCRAIFIDYVNMLNNFIPQHGKITSFIVPYYCESCKNQTTHTYQSQDVKLQAKGIPPVRVPCEKCGQEASIDVVVPDFFRFLNRPSSA